MNRVKLLLAVIVAGLIGLGWTAAAYAMSNVKSGDDVALPSGQTADQTIFYSGRSVDIAGTVNGDVFCAGQTVTVSGTINGDVICAGQDVTVSGTVTGDVRVAGQNVTVSGRVANDLSVLAQAVTIDGTAHVGRDTQLGAQSAAVNGTIGRDLTGGSTSLAINGTVGRDVLATDMYLSLGSSSAVGGGITYTSTHMLSRAGGARITGTITRHQPPKQATRHDAGAAIARSFWLTLYLLLSLLLVALVLVLLFPRFFHLATEIAYRSPWLTLLIGFVASIVVPALILLLMLTVIGIPLAVILLLAWMLVCVLAWVFTAYYIGGVMLHHSTRNPIWYMLLGAAIIILLSFIPFLGFFVWLLSLWLGAGIIVRQYVRLPRPRYEVERA